MTTTPREQAALDLKVARADAIHNYATLELSLCMLFAHLLKAPNDIAAIVFYKITNSRFRNSIIEALLEKNFGTKYDTYWHGTPGSPRKEKQSGLFAVVRQLDETRNNIVHWTIAVRIGNEPITEELIPPNVWGISNETRRITVDDLQAFIKKASFASRSVTMFSHLCSLALQPEPWRDIFQQPGSYPPSNTHPLFQS